jgi:enamine deaminase RidA (YjgF/YER057c/UK114 family)
LSSRADPDELLRSLGSRPLPESLGVPYLLFRRTGSLLYTAGQIARNGDQLVAQGKLGADVSLEQGRICARQTAINTLLVVVEALGTLRAIASTIKLTVFVASAPDFTEHPAVANAASELMIEVLGPGGQHARSAIGVATLPRDTPVELEAIFEVAE